jgi:hypothetical protein
MLRLSCPRHLGTFLGHYDSSALQMTCKTMQRIIPLSFMNWREFYDDVLVDRVLLECVPKTIDDDGCVISIASQIWTDNEIILEINWSKYGVSVEEYSAGGNRSRFFYLRESLLQWLDGHLCSRNDWTEVLLFENFPSMSSQ